MHTIITVSKLFKMLKFFVRHEEILSIQSQLNTFVFLLTVVPDDVCVRDERSPSHIAEGDYSRFWLGFSLQELGPWGVQFHYHKKHFYIFT